jgi:hypothetical protein
MFSLSLPPVVCRRAHILFTLFVFVCIVVSNTYCVVFFCFVCLVLSVHNTASFSELSILNCPFSILQCLFKTQKNANYLSTAVELINPINFTPTAVKINIHVLTHFTINMIYKSYKRVQYF